MALVCNICGYEPTSKANLIDHLCASHGLSRIHSRKEIESGNHQRARQNKEDGESQKGGDTKLAQTTSPKRNESVLVDEQFTFHRSPWSELEGKQLELAEDLRKLTSQLGRVPTMGDIGKSPDLSKNEYQESFGSFTGARALAGISRIDPAEYDHSSDGPRKYSEWDLVNKIWYTMERRGKASIRSVSKTTGVGQSTFRYRFGSWSAALERSKIDGPEPSVESQRKPKEKHYETSRFCNLREEALERDDYQCQKCGLSEEENQEKYGVGLNVHHIKDIEEFSDPEDADTLENLESLCSKCHGQEHPFSEK